MKPTRKTQLSSKAQTLAALAKHGKQNMTDKDASDCSLPDGNRNAMRSRVYTDTGEHVPDSYCAPWLLSDVFSLPAKKGTRS